MEKNSSQKMRNIAIIIAVIVVAIIVVLLLLKGCGAKEYTVSFDSNGGSVVNSVVVKENETVKEPTAPTRDGYTFAGWYLNDKLYDFSTPVTSDITLKAQWEAVNNDFVVDVETLSLTVGSTGKIKVTLSGDLKDAKLVWTSSDESIATVDSKGNVKALKEGEVTITVSTEDGKYSKTIKVTVRPATDVAVSKVTISGKTTVEVGKSIKLTANVTPKNATNKKVTWKSSDPSIATVDANGNVKGLKAGTVTITVTTEDGAKTNSVKITVTEPAKEDQPAVKPDDTPKEVKVTKITITGNATMDYGSSQTLNVSVEPNTATNKGVTWSVTNGATIDQNGKVTITGDVDEVTVTATAKDGSGVKGTFTIKVNAVYAIVLTGQDMGANMGVTRYDYEVTKNGKTFTDYTNLKVNGVEIFGSTVQSSAVNAGNSATMTVKGSTVNLKVIK